MFIYFAYNQFLLHWANENQPNKEYLGHYFQNGNICKELKPFVLVGQRERGQQWLKQRKVRENISGDTNYLWQ